MNSPLPEIDYAFLEDFLVRLLNTPSPTGYTERAIALVQEALAALPSLSLRRTRKGALLVTLPGLEAEPVRALTAHLDTLGAMVKSIKPSGRLALTAIGGFAWNSVEGEGCTVFTQAGGTVRGSLLPNHASVHVYTDVKDAKRDAENRRSTTRRVETASVPETTARTNSARGGRSSTTKSTGCRLRLRVAIRYATPATLPPTASKLR